MSASKDIRPMPILSRRCSNASQCSEYLIWETGQLQANCGFADLEARWDEIEPEPLRNGMLGRALRLELGSQATGPWGSVTIFGAGPAGGGDSDLCFGISDTPP